MTRYAAGLAAIVGPGGTVDAIETACRLVEWRGSISGGIEGPFAQCATLGSARSHQQKDLFVAWHGRLDDPESDYPLSDSETGPAFLAAYEQLGDQFANTLLGDFAVILIDKQKQLLIAARDWIGTRPLFWGSTGDRTVVASEQSLVTALLQVEHEPDLSNCKTFMGFGQLAPDATLVSGVRAVLPHGRIAVSFRAVQVDRSPLRFEPHNDPLGVAAETTKQLLRRAIARRSMDARTIATATSGGMDSTSVTAMLAEWNRNCPAQRAVHSISITFPAVPTCDESELAKAVADFHSLEWHSLPVSPDYLRMRPSLEAALHDGLCYTDVGYTLVFDEAASLKADVLLTGQIADAWITQYGLELRQSILEHDWASVASLAWLQATSSRRFALPRTVASAAKGLMNGQSGATFFEERAGRLDARLSLEQEERTAMYRGVRVEFPFADQQLARYLAGMRSTLRSDPVARTTKRIMREAMRASLPPEVLSNRHKTTFDDALKDAFSIQSDQPASTFVRRIYLTTFMSMSAEARAAALARIDATPAL